jgi:hypothetical protein
MGLITFPQSTQIPVDEIASVLRKPLTQGSPYLGLLRRSVLVQSAQNQWQCLVNVLRVVEEGAEGYPFEASTAVFQGLRVESSPIDAKVAGTAEGLRAELGRAMTALPVPELSPHASINRWTGRSQWSSWPAWVMTFSPKTLLPWPQLPDGPFYRASTGEIFTSPWELMRSWTGDGTIEQSTTHLSRLVVPDLRARFSDIVATASGFDVFVDSNQHQPLSCGLVGEDLYGLPVREVTQVRDGRASFASLGPLRSFQILLLEEQAGCLDRHSEHRYAALPGESLLSPLRERQRAWAASLEAALRSGEDLHTEYKAWLPTERDDSKYSELLDPEPALRLH